MPRARSSAGCCGGRRVPAALRQGDAPYSTSSFTARGCLGCTNEIFFIWLGLWGAEQVRSTNPQYRKCWAASSLSTDQRAFSRGKNQKICICLCPHLAQFSVLRTC